MRDSIIASSKPKKEVEYDDKEKIVKYESEINNLKEIIYFNELLEQKYGKVATGVFGADMLVTSVNEGPFTVMLDSKELFQ